MGVLMLLSRKYKKHNLEEKLKAVELYNKGYGSTTISKELSVSELQIKRWIRIYRAKGTKEFAKRSNIKVSFRFKQAIVKEVLENNLSYEEVSLIYPVSPSAVYSWVSKVKHMGYTSLMKIKNRERSRKNMARPKKKEPETELEKLQAEVEYLRVENAYLKKLSALVKRRTVRTRGRKSKPSNH